MKKLITVLLTALLLVASSAYAEGTLAERNKEYDSGNYAKAVKIYTPLALTGDVNAQYHLGYMFSTGQGLIQDYAEAIKWWKLGSASGDAWAQDALGGMYELGHGVKQNYVKAHMWYNLAATQGVKDAVKSRDIVAKEMSQQQIAEAQKLARECLARKYKDC